LLSETEKCLSSARHISYRTEPTDKNIVIVAGFSSNWNSWSPWWRCTDPETRSRYASNVCI
jgi:hypothetical protein